MHILRAFLLYLAVASSCAVAAADETNDPLHKSKEEREALLSSRIQSFQASHLDKGGPPQRNAFVERKKKRRTLSKTLSDKVKNVLLKEVIGGDGRNKKGVKAKVARFLFNQKKEKIFNKMTTTRNTKENKKNTINRRRTNLLSQFIPWMKDSSLESAHVRQLANDDGDAHSDDHGSDYDDMYGYHDDHYNDDHHEYNDDHGHDDYYYTPPTLFDILDQLSMAVTSINQTEYTEVVEGLTSVIGEVTNITIPSPEGFCADFDVTTTEDECVAAVSSVVTVLEGAIEAPWLLRDIVGYLEAWVNEVVSWETVEDIVGGIASMYGADGTIDGGLDAIRSFMSDLFQLAAALDPSINEYYSGTGDVGAFFFDALPHSVATEVLAYDYNMLDDFGDNLYETAYSLIDSIRYMLGEGYIEMPEGPAFHADICEVFGLVPANITAVISCDYFEDIGHGDIKTEYVDFCVKPDQDMEDYSAELFSMESTIDSTTMEEMGFEWLLEDLQYKNYKFDNYDFMALESMTCSIKGKLTRPIICNEKPLNTFLYKNGIERTCKWLRNRNHTDLICEKFDSAKYACPSTCCMCEEDPMEPFFRRYIEEDGVNVPEMKTCNWLSFRTPENLEKFCRKNYAPDGLKVASGACPITCGLCGDASSNKCQDSIDSFINNTYWIRHEDWSKYEYVYGYFDYGLFQYDYMTGNQTTLGLFYSREGNTFFYGGGSQCKEEDTQISSKVIVEATDDLGKNGTTYFSQTSPCTYELKLFTFCGDASSNKCQDSIDSFIDNTYWFRHEDWSKYEYVYGYFDYGLFQYDYTGNQTTLGYFYSREGNTFFYGGGSQCEEEDTQISSKVIVEATNDLGKNGTTYFSQTSPCTYELKLVTFCNSTNTTSATSLSWSSRNLFQHVIEFLFPQPEDEVLDWQK